MSHTLWFDIPQRCLACNSESNGREIAMYSGKLLFDQKDRWVVPGDVIEAEREDFYEAYFCLREPDGDNCIAIEQWGCPKCRRIQWSQLEFEQTGAMAFRLLRVVNLLPTGDALRRCHFISRKMEDDGFAEVNADNVAACLAQYP